MSATLELIVEAARYKAQIKDALGLTDREAGRAAISWIANERKKEAASLATAAAVNRQASATLGVSSATKGLAGSLKKLAPALMLVDSGSGAAAKALSKLTRASLVFNAETVGVLATLGPYIGVIAALAANLYIFAQNQKLAKQEAFEFGGKINGVSLASKDADSAQQALAESIQATRESSASTQIDIAVLTGEMSKLEAATLRATDALWKQSSPQFTTAARELSAAQDRLAAAEGHLNDVRAESEAQAGGAFSGVRSERAKAELAERRAGYEAAAQAAVYAAQEEVSAAQNRMSAKTREFNADKEALGLKLQLEDQSKRHRKAAEEAVKTDESAAKAALELAKAQRSAELAVLDPMDQLLAKQQLEMANLRTLAVLSRDRAAATAAMEAVELRQAEERADLAAKEAEKRREGQERELEAQKALAGAKMDLVDSSLSAAIQIADLVGAKNKDAAMEAFRVAQALAAVQVAMNTIVAISKASPVVPAMIAAGILGAAQEAAIAAQPPPSFYPGGLLPDEQAFIGHPREAVLNKQGRDAFGDEAIRAANRGESARGTVIVETRIDRGVVSAAMARGVRAGDRLSQELGRRTGRLGHSEA